MPDKRQFIGKEQGEKQSTVRRSGYMQDMVITSAGALIVGGGIGTNTYKSLEGNARPLCILDCRQWTIGPSF